MIDTDLGHAGGTFERNFADVWELVTDCLPDALAQIQGPRQITWAEFDRRACALANLLLHAGLGHQDKVALYLHNGPEYLETVFAAFKVAMVPVNTNYRYAEDELVYLWTNADAAAVVFHGRFAPTVERIRSRVPQVRAWVWVDDGSGARPRWAMPYKEVVDASPAERVVAPWGRSGDDIFMLYTGGTTGMPKGVMWRQDDVFHLLNEGAKVRLPNDQPLTALGTMFDRRGPVFIPACPLMHGTGIFGAFGAMSSGGCVVTLEQQRFDAVELLDAIERNRVESIAIVGDAFALPMLSELDRAPGRWDISSLRVVTSSGVMWSLDVKERLRGHNERLVLLDSLGSSEAIGMASAVTRSTNGAAPATGRFELGPNTAVIAENGGFVTAGSDQIGMLALRGRMPVGYYNDPDKSDATFRTINGERWSVPGDYARVEADGTLILLGRGSVCINTGGEKVFPEEVEEVLKEIAEIQDAVVVGLLDERLGEVVAAVVELAPDVELDESAVRSLVRSRLAAYKVPRHLIAVSSLERAANGKINYPRWKSHVAEQLRSEGEP